MVECGVPSINSILLNDAPKFQSSCAFVFIFSDTCVFRFLFNPPFANLPHSFRSRIPSLIGEPGGVTRRRGTPRARVWTFSSSLVVNRRSFVKSNVGQKEG